MTTPCSGSKRAGSAAPTTSSTRGAAPRRVRVRARPRGRRRGRRGSAPAAAERWEVASRRPRRRRGVPVLPTLRRVSYAATTGAARDTALADMYGFVPVDRATGAVGRLLEVPVPRAQTRCSSPSPTPSIRCSQRCSTRSEPASGGGSPSRAHGAGRRGRGARPRDPRPRGRGRRAWTPAPGSSWSRAPVRATRPASTLARRFGADLDRRRRSRRSGRHAARRDRRAWPTSSSTSRPTRPQRPDAGRRSRSPRRHRGRRGDPRRRSARQAFVLISSSSRSSGLLGALGVDVTAYTAAFDLIASDRYPFRRPAARRVVGLDDAGDLLATMAGETDERRADPRRGATVTGHVPREGAGRATNASNRPCCARSIAAVSSGCHWTPTTQGPSGSSSSVASMIAVVGVRGDDEACRPLARRPGGGDTSTRRACVPHRGAESRPGIDVTSCSYAPPELAGRAVLLDAVTVGDVLVERPAERDVQHLVASADREDGHPAFDRGTGESRARSCRAARGRRRPSRRPGAVRGRVEVAAAEQQHAVEAVERALELVGVERLGHHHRLEAARAPQRLDVRHGHAHVVGGPALDLPLGDARVRGDGDQRSRHAPRAARSSAGAPSRSRRCRTRSTPGAPC